MFRPADPSRITGEEFHAVLRGAPATRQGDHAYRVLYPDGDPWFVAEWRPEGNVVLSTSYSSHRFLRNFANMFDQGLRIAGDLQARLFEDVGQREITKRNIDTLLVPGGKYVDLQAATWRRAIDQLASQGTAPLEFPLGPADTVSEYVLFHVTPARDLTDAELAALAREAKAIRIERRDGAAWCALDDDVDRSLTRLLRRPDGDWQIWPAWGQAPFSRIAEVTVALAEALHRAAGGDIAFLGHRYDAALQKDLRSKLAGLGVDFYTWTQQLI
jgi:hypothetical protein